MRWRSRYWLILILIGLQTCTITDEDTAPSTGLESDDATVADVYRLQNLEAIRITGHWRFQPTDSPQIRSDFTFARTDYDDSDWNIIRVPGSWHQYGYEHDGIAWYRTELILPERFQKFGLGLMFPYVDAGYAVYVNGHHIGDQGKISRDGRLVRGSSRAGYFEVPAHILHAGRNTLALRMHSYGIVGGFITPDLYAGPPTQVREIFLRHLIWHGAVGAMFLFFGLYHFMLFIARTGERHYLYFALYSAGVGLYVLAMNTVAGWVYDNNLFLHGLLHFALNSISVIFVLFIHTFYRVKTNRLLRYFAVATPVLMLFYVASLVSETGFSYYVKYGIPIVLLHILIAFGYGLYRTLGAARRRFYAARLTVVGFLLFGAAISFEIAGYLKFGDMAGYVEESFLVFVVLFMISMSVHFNHLHRSRERSVRKLAERMLRLSRARNEAERAERKYLHLFENSPDIIFSLDEEFKFLTVNRSVRDRLGFQVKQLIGLPFQDLIFVRDESSRFIKREVVKEKLLKARNEKRSVQFKVDLRTRMEQPREMLVRLSCVDLDDRFILFGTASSVPEDELLRYTRTESKHFVLDNNLNVAELISERITAPLFHLISGPEAAGARMGLREIIVNAIEHGNLNITADEKSKSLADSTYMRLFNERLRDPRYRNRKVIVDYELTTEYARYVVTDEGGGFEHSQVTGARIQDLNRENLLHGRGILITLQQFDRVNYNARGNQVELIRTFANAEPPDPNQDVVSATRL
ncbi:MAG: ATP-binding protein [Leptospiraceae bacterium]|nr:ATP-binding protein [Leptospiraceae bacterium]